MGPDGNVPSGLQSAKLIVKLRTDIWTWDQAEKKELKNRKTTKLHVGSRLYLNDDWGTVLAAGTSQSKASVRFDFSGEKLVRTQAQIVAGIVAAAEHVDPALGVAPR